MKTTEQKRAEFITLIGQNGYALSETKTHVGGDIYARTWNRVFNVAWHGEKESTLTIELFDSYGVPVARIYHNGRLESVREYSSPKRAINALREVVRFAGYVYEEAAV